MDRNLLNQAMTKQELGAKTVNRTRFVHTTGIIFILGDMVILLICLIAAHWLRFHALGDVGTHQHTVPAHEYYLQFFIAWAVAMFIFVYCEMYSGEYWLRPRFQAVLSLKPILAWTAVFTLLTLTLRIQPEISRLFILYAAGLMLVLIPTWRYLFSRHMLQARYADVLRHKTLVIGWNQRVQDLIEYSNTPHSYFPLQIHGVLLTEPLSDDFPDIYSVQIEQWTEQTNLQEILEQNHYDTVLLADMDIPSERKREVQLATARTMAECMVLPNDHIARLSSCLQVESFQGIPLLTQRNRPLDRMGYSILKRTTDIAGGLIGLILFSPIIAYFCWRVYRESPGPVFYRQTRLGRYGKPFQIIKIRSMRLDAESRSGAQWAAKDDPRRLKVGAFMRRMNIDELPQFWNVLKGEMSLVGPRPERPELIKNFEDCIDYYNLRMTVKPGLTGWAQVNGWRGDTELQPRIACDIEYIEHAGFWFDIYILLKTLTAYQNAH